LIQQPRTKTMVTVQVATLNVVMKLNIVQKKVNAQSQIGDSVPMTVTKMNQIVIL